MLQVILLSMALATAQPAVQAPATTQMIDTAKYEEVAETIDGVLEGDLEAKTLLLANSSEEAEIESAQPATPEAIVTPTPKPERVFKYSEGYIRVRSEASEKADRKYLLSPGEKVEVLDATKKKGQKWFRIKVADKKGWCLGKYLSETKKEAKKAADAAKSYFRITGYCPCDICSEGYGRSTASGRRCRAGHTIAADLSVLPMYTQVYIEGIGEREVEDVGGAINDKHIDVFMDEHSQCSSVTFDSSAVYIIRG